MRLRLRSLEPIHDGGLATLFRRLVLCYELISMITEKNNMHEMDTWMFFKWFFKAAVAIYLVTNTFDIGQNVVAGAAGVIHGNTSIDIQSTLDSMRTGMEATVFPSSSPQMPLCYLWGAFYLPPFLQKNKPRYCSAMRSAIPGLSRWVFSFNAASSFLQARLQLTAVIQLAFTLLVKLDKISETPVFSRLSDLAPIIT